MQTASILQLRQTVKSGMELDLAAIIPPINSIILEKSFADRTKLKIQERTLAALFSEDPLKRETFSRMIWDEG